MHLYLHIPFCAQACHYCDFHFSTRLSGREAMVMALKRELELQKNYLPPTPLDTVYFGGGTPSLLSESELQILFEAIHRNFSVAKNAEITLEANPDDLTTEKLHVVRRLGINRLSIGIQSFNENHLRHLHRLHSAAEGEASIRRAQDMGIENLSIDLIYAIPAESHGVWEADFAKTIALGVPHLSAYCLTIEPQTVFGNWLKRKKLRPIDEAFAAQQFEMLTSQLMSHGYEHYEISNFAKPGQYSRHNTSYWRQEPYLGVGPSAHSFDGATSRQFNIANNARYVESVGRNEIPAEVETLSEKDRINEYLLTGLRTQWGCDWGKLKAISATGLAEVLALVPPLVERGWLRREENLLRLTSAGKLFADRVAAELFWV
jgi:oxygen-independent coproporphyrinogen-3 oxidase